MAKFKPGDVVYYTGAIDDGQRHGVVIETPKGKEPQSNVWAHWTGDGVEWSRPQHTDPNTCEPNPDADRFWTAYVAAKLLGDVPDSPY